MGTTDGTASGGAWLLFDLLGSVAGAESGASGATSAVTTALRYDAFGQTIGTYPATGSSLPVRYRGLIDLAPTADTDVAGTGSDPLYAMGARLYAPHLGAFTSFDTYAGQAQDPASLNRYLYAHANPATLIDPTGHYACEADCDGDPTDEELDNARDDAVKNVQNPPRQTAPKPGPTTGYQSPDANNPTTTSTGPAQTAGGAVPPIAMIAGVPVGPDGSPLTQDDMSHLYAQCMSLGDEKACEAWRRGTENLYQADLDFCADNAEVCDLRAQETAMTIAVALELALTGALIFVPPPGLDEAAAGGAAAATMTKLQGIRDRIAALLTRSPAKPGTLAPSWGPWTRSSFQGNRVYQRNDIIDPARIDTKGRTNLERMKGGLAPIGPDDVEVNLHHALQTMDGPIVELTYTMHLRQPMARIIHINPPTIPSGIDRPAFNAWKRSYWMSRACDFGEC